MLPRLDLSFFKRLTPSARRLLFVLIGIALAFFALHALTRGRDIPPFWHKLLNLDSELTLSATFNAAQLFAASLLAVLIALWGREPGGNSRFIWWFLAVAFLYLAADEIGSIHERLPVPGRREPALRAVGAFGLLVAAVSVLAFRSRPGNQRWLLYFLLGGLAVLGIGGISFEYFHNYIICRPLYHLGLCDVKKTFNFEELLEMVGSSLMLAGMFAYAHHHIARETWRRARLIVAGGVLLWFVGVASNIWLLPGVMARVASQPVGTEYLDGDLTLVGYRFSDDVLRPGKRARLTLYWQANAPLESDYILSAHLVMRSDLRSVAQEDMPLGGWDDWRTPTWFPGVTMRDAARFDLPDDLPTPEGYWLLLSVVEAHSNNKYRIDFGRAVEVPPTRTDRELVEPNVIALFSVPGLSDTPDPLAETPASYRFDDGMTLAAYSLPEDAALGESLPMAFSWQTDAAVGPDLIQFVHLFHENGEDYYVFDQPPFDGHFPTSDWPAGIAVTDAAWDIPLPPDLPPGEYRVHTGLYDPLSGERRPVSMPDGTPVPDASIFLDTLRLE